uniref:Uncharacterized protein n=1 Tax=Lygus hesperus TaxID=30085 RepID=A0A146LUK6_LYGHE
MCFGGGVTLLNYPTVTRILELATHICGIYFLILISALFCYHCCSTNSPCPEYLCGQQQQTWVHVPHTCRYFVTPHPDLGTVLMCQWISCRASFGSQDGVV